MDSQERALAIYLCIVTPLLWYVSVKIVSYYAEASTPNHTIQTIRIGFFCVFGIFSLVPMDVAIALVNRNPIMDPDNGAGYTRDTRSLSILYSLFYLVVLLWTCLVLCYQEYLNTDGYFTQNDRAKSSAKRLVIDYIPLIGAGIPLLIILLYMNVKILKKK